MAESALHIPHDAFQLPAPLQTLIERAPVLKKTTLFLWRTVEHWGGDECPIKAAAMAFFGLLSVFPIILAVVAILAQVLAGNQLLLSSFQNFVTQFFPGPTGDNVSEELRSTIEGISGSNTTTLGVVAIVSLLWSGRAYFATLAAVLNSIWPNATPRSFLQQQMVLWSTFLGAGLLWLLSTLIAFSLSVAQALSQYLPFSFLDELPWLDVLSRLSSWSLTALMFWLIYWYLPNVQKGRKKRVVLACAVLAAVAWELAKIFFAQFLGNVTTYDRTYGGVAGVVVTMMWIYISSSILLLGAEAAAAYQETCEYMEEGEAALAPAGKTEMPADNNEAAAFVAKPL